MATLDDARGAKAFNQSRIDPLFPDRHTIISGYHARMEKAIQATLASGAKAPLFFLWEQMSSEDLQMPLRLDCAKALLPYLHRKQPVAIEGSQPGEAIRFQQLQLNADGLEKLKGMSDEELEHLAILTTKLASSGAVVNGVGEAEEEQADQVLSGHGAAEEGTV